jgi:hypothetical protein
LLYLCPNYEGNPSTGCAILPPLSWKVKKYFYKKMVGVA